MGINFGKSLRFDRLTREMTQEQLGEMLGTTQQNIYSWEVGRTSPKKTHLERIVQIFGEDSSVARLLEATGGELAMESEAETTGPTCARTIVFVDADNQSPGLANTLVAWLSNLGRQLDQVFVSGNGNGDLVRRWVRELETHAPDAEVSSYVAKVRKQAADARLVLEMATLFHGAPQAGELVLVVSRDDLLLAAGECLSQRGHSVMAVINAASPAAGATADLPVLALAAKPVPEAIAESHCMQPGPTESIEFDIAKICAHLKARVPSAPDGSRSATEVGQCLGKLGYDKNARDKIVKSLPGLKRVGSGPEVRLIF